MPPTHRALARQMRPTQRKISRSPAPEQPPLALLLLQLALDHRLIGTVQKTDRLLRVIAQKTAPLELQLVGIGRIAIGTTHLEHVEEPRMSQLVHQSLLLLDGRKIAGHQLGEALVLCANHVPHVLQIADARLASAQRTVVLYLCSRKRYILVTFLHR